MGSGGEEDIDTMILPVLAHRRKRFGVGRTGGSASRKINGKNRREIR
jgi:hypothetical protein